MTSQIDVTNDPNYLPVLNHGFVGIIQVLGDDAAITDAARVSYGTGTKSLRENRGLLRYLMRHDHSSPYEMTAIKLHIKAPIFVLRQLYRHRTHSANEYSGRYSIMSDEFYLPDPETIQPQNPNNKQGRAGEVSQISRDGVRWMMQTMHEQCYDAYKIFLGDRQGRDNDYPNELLYDPYGDDPLLDDEFAGIARELARTVLPVANYSELYWQQNLLNMFKLLKLRADSHAQFEIRQYSDAIYTLIKPYFPEACAAFEDYMRDAVKLSRMEVRLLQELLASKTSLDDMIIAAGGEKAFATSRDLTMRELDEFRSKFIS